MLEYLAPFGQLPSCASQSGVGYSELPVSIQAVELFQVWLMPTSKVFGSLWFDTCVFVGALRHVRSAR